MMMMIIIIIIIIIITIIIEAKHEVQTFDIAECQNTNTKNTKS